MSKKITSSLDDLLHELHKDPEFRKAYRRQAPYYELLLEVLRRRKQLGLTQEELAERAGMHQSTVSRIESGEHDIRLSTLIEIAEALETRVNIWLEPLYEEDEKEYMKLFTSSTTQKAAEEYTEGRAVSHERIRI